MTAKILVVTEDVFVWARIRAAAEAAGREAVRAADDAAVRAALETHEVDRVLADLAVRTVDVLAWAARWKALPRPPPLVGFGPHVDERALAAALAAGFDDAMPNSRFHRLLTEMIG